MKGTILDFNLQEGIGIISGDDGKRYKFVLKEWKEKEPPKRYDAVDFDVDENGMAKEVYYDIQKIEQAKSHTSSSSSGKNKIVAFLLAFFLGGFGAHKFYLGCMKEGAIMLAVYIFGWYLLFPSIAVQIIALIEAVIYLTKSDEEFEEIYVKNQKCWF